MLIKAFFIALSLLMFAGCATTAKYEAKLNAWMGHDINELNDSWGYPESSFTALNGNTVYVYNDRASMVVPTQTTYSGRITPEGAFSANSYTTGGQTVNFDCKTFFEVNQDKKIIKWRWEGNNCKSH